MSRSKRKVRRVVKPAPTGDRDEVVMELLRAVRAFGDAHDRMSTGMKHSLDVNITDLATLRLLIIRQEQGRQVTPAEISRHLRISTASITKLLDRLTASGHVTRSPHPVDRRAVVVSLTDAARSEFFKMFGKRLVAMRLAFSDFTDEELRTAALVLNAVGTALDGDANDGDANDQVS